MKYALILFLLLTLPFVVARSTVTEQNHPALALGVLRMKNTLPPPRANPFLQQTLLLCSNGATRCEKKEFQLCKGSMWTTTQTCTKTQLCTKKGCSALGGSTDNSRFQQPLVAPTLPELPGTDLNCPTLKLTLTKSPTPPYDLKKGDCALKGKSTQINQYLAELQKIADQCKTHIEPNWKQVTQTSDFIHKKIDSLPVAPPYNKINPPATCSESGSLDNLPSDTNKLVPPDFYYTDWLKRIGTDVQKYCTAIDQLMKPLIEICKNKNKEIACTIADQAGVTDGERNSLHMSINAVMNAEQINHNALEFTYTKTIMEYGIGGFKTTFNPKNLKCPGDANSAMTGPNQKSSTLPWTRTVPTLR